MIVMNGYLLSLGVFTSIILLLGSVIPTMAISPTQLKSCLDKMPKDYTSAQKKVYTDKCKKEIQNPKPGKREPTRFDYYASGLVQMCIMYKYQDKPSSIKSFEAVMKKHFDETPESLKGWCNNFYKDSIWSDKTMTPRKIYDHYANKFKLSLP